MEEKTIFVPEPKECPAEKYDRKVTHFFRAILRMVEHIIAALTILILALALCLEVYRMITEGLSYVSNLEHALHTLLTIVVGMEFVRMLIDTTPASILEVLTVAITRHVILSHDDPLSNVACIACIAGLFAIRRFLIPKNEMKETLVEEI